MNPCLHHRNENHSTNFAPGKTTSLATNTTTSTVITTTTGSSFVNHNNISTRITSNKNIICTAKNRSSNCINHKSKGIRKSESSSSSLAKPISVKVKKSLHPIFPSDEEDEDEYCACYYQEEEEESILSNIYTQYECEFSDGDLIRDSFSESSFDSPHPSDSSAHDSDSDENANSKQSHASSSPPSSPSASTSITTSPGKIFISSHQHVILNEKNSIPDTQSTSPNSLLDQTVEWIKRELRRRSELPGANYYEKDVEYFCQQDWQLKRFLPDLFLSQFSPQHSHQHCNSNLNQGANCNSNQNSNNKQQGNINPVQVSHGSHLSLKPLTSSDISSIVDAIETCLTWRYSIRIREISLKDFPVEFFSTGLFEFGTHQKTGKKLIYIQGRNHRKLPELSTQLQLFASVLYESVDKELEGKQMTAFLDLSGVSLDNADTFMFKHTIDLMFNYFPNLLDQIYVYEVSWYLKPIVYMILKVIPEKYTKLVTMVKKKDLTLLDPFMVPSKLGGALETSSMEPPDDCIKLDTFVKVNNFPDSLVAKAKKLYGLK